MNGMFDAPIGIGFFTECLMAGPFLAPIHRLSPCDGIAAGGEFGGRLSAFLASSLAFRARMISTRGSFPDGLDPPEAFDFANNA